MNTAKEEFALKHAPCYIYDKAAIISRCRELKDTLSQVRFLYSVKTNPFELVLATIASEGLGADAASSEEVLKAARCGIPASSIFYSSPGKTAWDIERALGKCVIIADSSNEVKLLQAYADKSGISLKIGLRINPAFGMGCEGCCSSKFGVDEEQLESIFAQLQHVKNIEIVGIHVHLRSQVLDAGVLARYYLQCYRLAEKIAAAYGSNMEFINFGSGIGTVYDEAQDVPVNLGKLAQTLQEIVCENAKGLRAQLYIETGRYLTCNAGTYYTRIVDIKKSMGVKYFIVENGLNGFLRPAVAALVKRLAPAAEGMEPLYTSQREFSVRGVAQAPLTGEAVERVTVVGNLCTGLDVIASDVLLPPLQIGDVLAISNAGSYGYSLSPMCFSSHRLPQEILWE